MQGEVGGQLRVRWQTVSRDPVCAVEPTGSAWRLGLLGMEGKSNSAGSALLSIFPVSEDDKSYDPRGSEVG